MAEYKNIFFIYLIFQVDNSCQGTVEYFENIIDKGQHDAANFKIPTDARKFRPDNKDIKDYGSYDFVIIGGGTSGSVLASRLSEKENFTVLVLEAGEFIQTNSILEIPYFAYLGQFSNYNWGFKSVPQTTACLGTTDQQCGYPEGRGVGGTTLINAMIYDRGTPGIYDIYAELVQDNSWSYSNVLRYFKKSENFHWINEMAPVEMEFHGKGGLLDVEHRVPNLDINDLFLQANIELGLPATDYNGPQRIGGTILQYYTRKGRRLDMGTAFLKPFLNRTNLEVSTGSYVTKIIFNKLKAAESVVFTKNGNYYMVKANKEIILCAGSIQSPQILMLSGIGPESHLREHGIDVLENLEVGSMLLDQPSTRHFIFSTNYTEPFSSLKEQIQEFLNATGLLTSARSCQADGFYQVLTPKSSIRDVEIMVDISYRSEIEKILSNWRNITNEELWGNTSTAIKFAVRNINPKSFGTVRLNSSDPFEYPLINPNFLSDAGNKDIEVMYRGLQLVFDLAETPSFKKINLSYDSQPLTACKDHIFKSKDYWYCFIRQVSQTTSHAVGTCRMGSSGDKGAVVDSELKVFGVKNLRVVDASVFPKSPGGHTSMPCVMIAEKTADIIKNTYGNKMPSKKLGSIVNI